MPPFCELSFWPWTSLTAASSPDSQKYCSAPEPLLAEAESGSAPNLTRCSRRNGARIAPLGESERSYAAHSIPWSKYRTAGWQRPESCGSRGPIPIYRPYYAAGWTTAIESSDYQWIQLVTTIRSCLIRGIVQMRLWQG